MKDATLELILKTRLLVGYLGERAQHGWWPTAFFEVSSRLFLEPVFSKTSRLAQYHGVLEAARRVHDDRLNVGSYHLFRLPEEMEQNLGELMLTLDDAWVSSLIKSPTEARVNLASFSEVSANEVAGPMSVGGIDALESAKGINKLAGIYLAAFSHGLQAFPYLVRQ